MRLPFALTAAAAMLLFCVSTGHAAAEPSAGAHLSFLHADGSKFVTDDGKPVLLKGCNLGNWLMIEPWMLGGCLEMRDQAQLFSTLDQRFGADRAAHLIDLYRDGYITTRDFQIIKSFGFNVVRLPFDYRLVQSDTPPFEIKPDAFRWIDHALDLAEHAGVYVILDLHGAPGGQSDQMHTGEAGQNKLWGSEEDQKRTAEVWRAVAAHCKDRAVVAAYDLLNEPYGDFHTDLRPALLKLIPQLYAAVRSSDDRHVVFFPGALNGGVAFYGKPADHGWHGVGLTEHNYAGLFGGKRAVSSHAYLLNRTFPARRAMAERLGVPYYLGEFNVVLRATGGERMMREYYDRMAEDGFACTMWSYKIIGAKGGDIPADHWQMVANASPLPKLDLQSSSYEDFERFFQNLATMQLTIDQPLFKALTEPNPPALTLPSFPTLPSVAPAGAPPAGWTAIDIGGAHPGGQTVASDGAITLYGGGDDIYGTHDSFRFLSCPSTNGTCDLAAAIDSFLDSSEYAKAGVMARWGDAPDAAFAMAHIFPDGDVVFCARSKAGAPATETVRYVAATLPVEVRIKVNAGKADGFYREAGGKWISIGSADVPTTSDFQSGLALCSHASGQLATARFRVDDPASIARQTSELPAPADPPSLLQNGSFEQAGAQPNIADHWNSWGPNLARSADAPLGHSGSAQLVYNHSQVMSSDDSGVWQDVPITAGQRYTFSVLAVRDSADQGHDADSIELSIESTQGDHQLALDSATFKVANLTTAPNWSKLAVTTTAVDSKLRVVIRINASKKAPRGGVVRFTNASLVPNNESP